MIKTLLALFTIVLLANCQMTQKESKQLSSAVVAKERILEEVLRDQLDYSATPAASMTIIDSDGKYYSAASGKMSLFGEKPVTPDSQFFAGSATKIVIAILVMQQLDEGRLRLSDRIGKFFPKKYKNWRNITLQQLMTMTSGIVDYTIDTPSVAALLFKSRLGKDLDARNLMERVAKKDLIFRPGSDCHYSSANFVVLGQILEQITGKQLHRLFDERIAKKLNLKNMRLPHGKLDTTNLVRGYFNIFEVVRGLGLPSGVYSTFPKRIRYGDGNVDVTEYFDEKFTWATGNVITNSRDLATFMRALFRGQLVNKKWLERMKVTRPCTIGTTPWNYGFGSMYYDVRLGDRKVRAYGHGGLTYGFRSVNLYVPELDISLSHIQNSSPVAEYVAVEEALTRFINSAPVQEREQRCSSSTKFDGLITNKKNRLMLKAYGRVDAGKGGHYALSSDIKRYTEDGNLRPPGLNLDLIRKVKKVVKPLNYDQVAGQADLSTLKLEGDMVSLRSVGYLDVSSKEKQEYAIVVQFPKSALDRGPRVFRKANLREFQIGMYKSVNQSDSFCIDSVFKWQNQDYLSVCNQSAGPVQDGSLIKFQGEFEVTSDQRTVRNGLRTMSIQRCLPRSYFEN